MNILDLVFGPSYDTQLAPAEEMAFQKWKKQYAPNDSGQDYDYRGAFMSGLTPNQVGHWPDTFKKPNHPTFSVESKYAQMGSPGAWAGENFISPTILRPE